MATKEATSLHFHEMELDDRILKAVAKLGWEEPTLIQEKAIPLVLEGKDVLVRARTGSGKTAAFSIPVIQKVINNKLRSAHQTVNALILAPSKELCGQIHSVLVHLTSKCSREVRCTDISSSGDLNLQKPLLVTNPDIVVATPARALAHIKANNLKVKSSLNTLIIDEADLIFSFGFENDIKEILSYMPTIYQAVLASATLSEDVKNLKKIILRNPVILKLEEPELAPCSQLQHYHLNAEEDDKAAILFALLKLNLIRGKTIIFVRTVDRCYKLKLYLEQFKISSCVLNSELPAAVRCLSVEQFNKGRYQIIIASDEKSLVKPEGDTPISIKLSKSGKSIQSSKRKKDKESGVSRGIDFQHVSNVLNFDFPEDVSSYIHRAGRTARGNNRGIVLSFVSIREQALLRSAESYLSEGLNTVSVIKTYEFALEQVEGFRYRSRDAWRAVTRIAVREARLKEIKQELINCKKLKGFFEENPNELAALRRDKSLHTVRLQPHLAHVPDYIVPEGLKSTDENATTDNVVVKKRKKSNFEYKSAKRFKYQAKRSNPLSSLAVKDSKNRDGQ